ncbi:hypothetical protein [Campylobacter sp. RM12647]|uniref:hypothetical protein n=1 Tax=Campylobacter sp. RM12647 TaxID=2735737 RepID=UPI001D44D7E5|nr:hypothetical protein [Campylobacter sp. RM12647]
MKKILLSLALISGLFAVDISNIDKACKNQDQSNCAFELDEYCKEDLKACYQYSKDLCAKDNFSGCLMTAIANVKLVKEQLIDIKEAYIDAQKAISKLCELPNIIVKNESSHNKFCVVAGDGLVLKDGKNYGLETNPQKALSYYKRACDAQSSMGCERYNSLKTFLNK